MAKDTNTINRRTILRNVSVGTAIVGVATSTVSANSGVGKDKVETSEQDSHLSCTSWEHHSDFCPESTKTRDLTATSMSDCEESWVEFNCINDQEHRRECCYDPHQLEYDSDSIVASGVTEVHGELTTSVARETEWRSPYEDDPVESYWMAQFNLVTLAETRNESGSLVCFVDESELNINRSGNGQLRTFIQDDNREDENWVGGSGDLDKSSEYDIGDYGEEILTFALGEIPGGFGTGWSAGEMLGSMYNMYTDEYEFDDTISLAYNWDDNSPCSNQAESTAHWLRFEVTNMDGGDEATLSVSDETNIDGPTMETDITMPVSAPSADPDTLREMSDAELQEQNMSAATVKEIRESPQNYGVSSESIESEHPETLIFLGETE
ncbi:hypothetical protein [Natrialba magadii]|nr:hypothetical protein [Natrialba magadii]